MIDGVIALNDDTALQPFRRLRPSASDRRSSALPKLVGCLVLALCALDGEAAVTATDAWVRGTVPAQKATGAYLTLVSTENARLVKVATPAAASAEIHESEMERGTMRMKPVEFVALPAGKRVELKPGGYHVMLLGVARPLAAGDSVPLTLTLEAPDGKRTTLDVKAEVRPLGR
jgi:copper(I)-binding protein